MSSPLIIHNLQAHQYYNPNYKAKNEKEQQYIKESNFYRCNAEFSYLDYINRKNSCEKLELETIKKLDLMLEENIIQNYNYLNYQNERPGSTGSFDKDGDITLSKMKEYEKKMQSTKSTIWTSILSFTPEYSELFMNNKNQAFLTIKNTINNFFKKCGLDPNNIEWTCAYHVNTDNKHCHIAFWEKEKTKINSKGNKCFSNWKLPKEAIESYKTDIAYFHKHEPLTYLTLRDNIKNDVTSLIKKDKSKILENLDLKLTNIKSYQYARLTLENQNILNCTIDKIINSNPELSKLYTTYYQKLMKTQSDILKNCKEVKVKPSLNQKQFMSSRVKEFYNRCGNSILHVLKEYREIKKDTEYVKKEIRAEALNKLKNQSSANSRRIIYKTSVATRGKHSKIAALLQRMVVTVATDVSRESDSLDNWWIRKKDTDNEKIWKD